MEWRQANHARVHGPDRRQLPSCRPTGRDEPLHRCDVTPHYAPFPTYKGGVFLRAVRSTGARARPSPGKRVLRSALAATSLMLTVATVEGVAQERTKIARVGYLAQAPAASFAPRVDALRAGLLDLGYIEGSNLILGGTWTPYAFSGPLGDLAVLWSAIRARRMQKDQLRAAHTIPPSRIGRQASSRRPCCHKESQWRPAIEFGWAGVDGAASALALRFRELFVGPAD